MKKYEPQYVGDEVAMQGWESAALFAQGVKMAGKNLTQANVIAQTNKIKAFTANGLTTPVNWVTAHTFVCAAVLQCLYSGQGGKVRPGVQPGEERVQLLRVDERQEGARLPVARRHSGSRLRPDGPVERRRPAWSNFSDSPFQASPSGVPTPSWPSDWS